MRSQPDPEVGDFDIDWQTIEDSGSLRWANVPIRLIDELLEAAQRLIGRPPDTTY